MKAEGVKQELGRPSLKIKTSGPLINRYISLT